MQIDRCICFDKTFAELKRVADRHTCETIEQLQRFVEFGRNCKLCHPYVRRMLVTGETVFREILED